MFASLPSGKISGMHVYMCVSACFMYRRRHEAAGLHHLYKCVSHVFDVVQSSTWGLRNEAFLFSVCLLNFYFLLHITHNCLHLPCNVAFPSFNFSVVRRLLFLCSVSLPVYKEGGLLPLTEPTAPSNKPHSNLKVEGSY